MLKYSMLVLGLMAATPVFADVENPCADLWFSRNAMLDQAGYCFSSRLGKALFDNADCTTKQPEPSRIVRAQIAAILKLERADPDGFYEACNIDTSRRKLELVAIPLRKQLDFQPATDGGTSMCFGYLGNDIRLYSAPWKGARAVGTIAAGDDITFGHLDWKGWSFSLIGQHGDWRAAGWYKARIGERCKAFAG